MTYEVRVTPPAKRHLERLPDRQRDAILETLYGPIAENPHRIGKPLRLQLEGLHVARRGDYRIVYAISEPDLVFVLRIAHRRDAYRA